MFKAYFYCIFLCFLLGVSWPLFSQQYNFQNFTVEQGLSQSQNRAIFEDSRGYLWFGSIEGGISQYDGLSFTVYTEQNGLISNIVYDIAEDSQNRLWVATSKGVSIFDGKQFTELEPEKLRNISVYKIIKDQENNMWLGSREKGLALWKNEQLIFFDSYPELYLQTIRAITFTDKNEAILGTDNGLIIASQKSIIDSAPLSRVVKMPEGSGRMLSLYYQNDTIWIGSDKGAYFYYNDQITLVDHPIIANSEIRDISGDRFGNVWIGTYTNGVYILEKGTVTNLNETNGLVNNRIQAILEDRWGNMWFSTFFGVSKFMGRSFSHLTESEGLASSLVWGFEEDFDGNIWIAHNEGLAYYDGRKINILGVKDGFQGKRAWAIRRDQNANLWVGSDNGVYRITNKKAFAVSNDQNQRQFVTMLYRTKDNLLWVGGNQGLSFIDLNKTPYTYQHFKSIEELGGRSINSMIVDQDGRIWLATEGGGLLIFEKDLRSSRRITTKNGLSSDVVNEIIQDQVGQIWLAHSLSGISKLEFTDRANLEFQTVNIGISEGLKSTNIYSLIKFDSTLWAGTEKGVYKISLKENHDPEIRFYDKEAGFAGLEANHKALLRDSKKNVWWGTIKGATRYQPQYDRLAPMPPKVYITNLSLFFEDYDWSKYAQGFTDWFFLPNQLVVPFDLNHITFKYTAVDLAKSSRIKFRFKLDGFDKDWSPASAKTEAVYSNIPPGEYSFMVMAATDEIWDNEFATIAFKVRMPFWLTWWFFVLCFLVLVLLVYIYIKLRIGYLKRIRETLTQRVKERTLEIEKQKTEIEAQRDEIEAQRDQLEERSSSLEVLLEEVSRKSTQITSSINYAQRIQEAMLPSHQGIKAAFQDSFILYVPRDIVSGDFYWFAEQGDLQFIAAVDCTGHGVPGAFMSMIANFLLNQAIIEKKLSSPAAILESINKGVIASLKQTDAVSGNRDGMDICLCVFHKTENKLEFAGAKRPLIIVHNGHVEELRGDRFSIGGTEQDSNRVFKQHRISYQPNTTFFLSTDGYADQFGGDDDRKFMTKRLKVLFKEIAYLSAFEQEKVLNRTIHRWRDGREQTDDILIIGIKK